MDKRLERKFQKLTSEYGFLLDYCEKWGFEQLNQPLRAGKWSTAQILTHFNLSLKYSLIYLNKKMLYPETITTNKIGSFIRSKWISAILRSDLKIKAPNGLDQFSDHILIEEIKAEWEKLSGNLQELLENYPDELLQKNIFRHPYTGRITISHTLSFMYEHLRRHSRQIERSTRTKHL